MNGRRTEGIVYPKLRAVEARPVTVGGRRAVFLFDPLDPVTSQLCVSPDDLFAVQRFDGRHSLRDIQAEYMRQFGTLLFTERLQELVRHLDEKMLLDSPRYREYLREEVNAFSRAEIRQAAHAGSAYPSEPSQLRAVLDPLSEWDAGGRAGVPRGAVLEGAVLPHIDLTRGAPVYGPTLAAIQASLSVSRPEEQPHARSTSGSLGLLKKSSSRSQGLSKRPVVPPTDRFERPRVGYRGFFKSPSLPTFIILGTAHAGMTQRFALTKKDFETPLGRIQTDQDLASALVERVGPQLLVDEYVHKREHSIEIQVLLLQYLFGSGAAFQILPVLCGSLEPVGAGLQSVEGADQVEAFTAALADCRRARKTRSVLMASADLAHLGPQFGDRDPVRSATRTLCEQEDRALLERMARGDADGFHQSVVQDGNPRRICGLSPIYVLLKSIDSSSSRLVGYHQAVDDAGHCLVSFAGMVFWR